MFSTSRGASVGSLSRVPGFDDLYLVKATAAPLVCRHLVESRGTRTVAVERPLKPLYLAALPVPVACCLPCCSPLLNRCATPESRRCSAPLCSSARSTAPSVRS